MLLVRACPSALAPPSLSLSFQHQRCHILIAGSLPTHHQPRSSTLGSVSQATAAVTEMLASTPREAIALLIHPGLFYLACYTLVVGIAVVVTHTVTRLCSRSSKATESPSSTSTVVLIGFITT